MAKDTYYAWSNFEKWDEDDPGNPRKMTRIECGDEVSADSLGMEEDEWNYLVEVGSVRTIPYPDMGSFQGSPVEYRKAQLAAAAEGGFYDSQHGAVSAKADPINPDDVSSIEAGTNLSGAKNTEPVPPEADQTK